MPEGGGDDGSGSRFMLHFGWDDKMLSGVAGVLGEVGDGCGANYVGVGVADV